MPKLESSTCLGCDSPVTFVRDTTGLYVATCVWCGAEMTQVTGIRTPSPARPLTVAGRSRAATATPASAVAATVPPVPLRRPPRGAPSYG